MRQTGPDADRPTVLVSLIGADSGQTARALARHGGARSYRPVFVISDSDTRPFLATGHTFEHVPGIPQIALHGQAGDWPRYVTERWRMIHTKWRPAWSVAYGQSFSEYLKAVEKNAIFSHQPGGKVWRIVSTSSKA